MSNKSGTSAQAITLPTGGGAVAAIGETFTPDAFTGAGTFSVPIEVPPGRNGVQPDLRLTYSTGDGNGPFGLGWSVGVPSVARRTSHGVPRYRDGAEQDTFVLAGGEELVPVGEPTPGVTRYRPRTEAAFARIDRDRRDGNDLWRVSTTDGLVHTYGTGSPPAVVADPAGRDRIFRWMLTGSEDPFGNRITYEYHRDTGTDGPHEWDQLYLERIAYVDHERDGADRFLVTATLVYEERPDPFSEHRAGFEIRTRLRCRRIEVRTHAAGGGDSGVLARTYELAYLDDLVAGGDRPAAERPPNGTSLLSRITVVGHDGDRTQSLPPIEFGYSRFEPERQRFQSLEATSGSMPLVSLADSDLETVDLTGNGLPDLVLLDGAAQFWRNLGGGRFDRPQPLADVPSNVRLGDPGVQLADMDGNGRADLLTLPGRGYFPLAFGGRWSAGDFVSYPAAPSVELGADDIRLVDLDGDGVTDALRTGATFELFFNDPQEGWNRVETRPRRPLAEFPDVQFSDPRVQLADLTGDGLQDIVLAESGRIDYWPYLGHGRWGPRVRMAASPVFRDGAGTPFDPRRVLFGDLDGDGLDDVVYVQAGRVTCWINQGGGRWSEPFEITGTPPFTDVDGVRLIDVLGTGMDGILWSSDPLPGAGDHYRFLDLTGGRKPYLLERIDNHRGAVTTLRHATSTAFFVADEERPATRWPAPLPFPVHVVEHVETADAISGVTLSTQFRYHHGYWDGVEREFRGFGLVEQLDDEVRDAPGPDETPPLLTRTWFHQGPVGDERTDVTEPDPSGRFWTGDPAVLGHVETIDGFLSALPRRARRDALRALRGSTLRSELYALDGTSREERPFTVTEHAYELRDETDGGGAGRVFSAHRVAERTTEWDRGTDPHTRFTFTDGHDRYGQPTRGIELSVPRGRDFRRRASDAEPYLGTVTATVFAQRDDERYLVDRVASVTTHEIANDGRPTVFELRDAVRQGSAELAVSAQVLTHYDGEPFEGLEIGRLGEHGAPVRVETLVLTPEMLGADAPPYLDPTGPPRWTDEYPAELRPLIPPLAGYTFSGGGNGVLRGYYAQIDRRQLDGRGLVVATRDPLGRDSIIEYDAFALLPVRSTDPAGLTTGASYDHRVLRPTLTTDVNGNRTAYAYGPLGLLERIAAVGRDGEQHGDTLDEPGTRYLHDLRGGGRPVSVRTVRRVHHIGDTGVAEPERNATIETVEYSDGLGRLVQQRSRAADVTFGDPTFGFGTLPDDQSDPGSTEPVIGRPITDPDQPNVVVSEWQVYDSKGRIVERYEPFFATGWDYARPTDAQLGQRTTMRYDARGRPSRTVDPDGSERLLVYGRPSSLGDPASFAPSPWEVFTYDENDNAGRTDPAAGQSYRHHWDTPGSVELDAMGRTVVAIERNRARGTDAVDELRSTNRYDIRGNCVGVTDPLDREAFGYTYDLADRAIRVESIDAGGHRCVFDAAAQEIERRDAKGALTLRAHDVLGRRSSLWARDGESEAVTLRVQVDYGDGGDPDQPPEARAAARAVNLLGALQRQHDEAGVLTVVAADFMGNVVERTRQVVATDDVAATSAAPGRSRALDPTVYVSSFAYDGLDRVTRLRAPAGTDDRRREVSYAYDAAGNIERIALDGTPVVERIVHDAMGQRTLVVLGNGTMTRYAYDRLTSRLARQRSDRYTSPSAGALTYRPSGTPLQDVAYRYDLVGNVVETIDRTPGCGVAANPEAGSIDDPALRALVASGAALVRRFGYDAVYRLTTAGGRECTAAGATSPWGDGPRCGFDSGNHGTPDQDNAPRLTSVYHDELAYDPVGNLVALTHAGSARTVRHFDVTPANNGIDALRTGGTTVHYRHDGAGNLVQEATSRHFAWDHANRMVSFQVRAGESAPSVDVRYLYDIDGHRIRKIARRQGGEAAVTTYIDGVFEHHRATGPGGAPIATTHVHVLDGEQRVLVAREGTPHRDDSGPDVQYVLADHLGNSTVVVDGAAGFVNREEYTPFGETSFGSFGRKRYRFNGKERDEESGLYVYAARSYAPWLGRWVSCDPMHAESLRRPDPPWTNLYTAFALNPMRHVDPDGRDPKDPPRLYSPLKRWGQKVLVLMRLNLPGMVTDPKGWQPEGDQMAELSKEVEVERKSSRLRKPTSTIPGPPSPSVDDSPIGRGGSRGGGGSAAARGGSSGLRRGMGIASKGARTAGRMAGPVLLAIPVVERSFMAGYYLREGEWRKAWDQVPGLIDDVNPVPSARPEKISQPVLGPDQSTFKARIEGPARSGCQICHDAVRVDNFYKTTAEGRQWERLNGPAMKGAFPIDAAVRHFEREAIPLNPQAAR